MVWYDRADLYDLLFSWDPVTEREFLLGASERWGIARPERILEPFCGPGRMLRAMPGTVVGFDLNPRMLRRAVADSLVFRADAARFAVRDGSFDLAFCLIDSFRHLLTEEQASAHLRCVGRALHAGAIYVLGFELTGDLPASTAGDEWTVQREGVEISGRFSALGDQDPDSRVELSHVQLEVRREGQETVERIEDFPPMRTYAREEFQDLVDEEGSFEIVAAFDRSYDLSRPVELDELGGSAVLVLRKCQRPT